MDSSDTPAYDGMWVLARNTLVTSNSPITATDFTWYWAGYSTGNSVDLQPTADYELVVDTLVATSGTCTQDGLWLYDNNTAPECEELWNIGNKGVSCVKMAGYFYRNMAIATTDALCDIAMDYIVQTVAVQIGSPSEADPGYTRFSASVDFSALQTVTVTAGATQIAGSFIAIAAAILATAF